MESLSADQIAMLLNDPATRATLMQLLAVPSLPGTSSTHAVSENLNNTPTVHSESPQLAAVSTGSANVEDENSEDDESENETNTRYNINKALGIDPFDRKVVQARRKKVTEFLLSEYRIRLNKPYTHWRNKTWIATVNTVFEHFSPIYGWKRKAIEALLKLMCEDNVRNARKLIKKRALEAAVASSGSNPPPPPPHQSSSKKQRSVLKETGIAKKKTLLRRPNRNTSSHIQAATDTTSSGSSAGQANSPENLNVSNSLTPSVDAEAAEPMTETVPVCTSSSLPSLIFIDV
jgi:hypothetical protein